MVVYLLLIFCSVLLISFQDSIIYRSKSLRNTIFFSFVLLLFLLTILRSQSVGTDYQAYNGYFYSSSFDLKNQYIENGYILLNEFAQKIGIFLIIPAFEFIVSFFGMYELSKTFKTNSFAFLGFYILTYVYMQSFNALRQFIAIGFVSFGCAFLAGKTKSKYLYFIIFVLIAYEFHSSSLLMLFLPLMSRIHVTKWLACISMILTSLLFFTGLGFKITQPIIGLDNHYAIKYGQDTTFLSATGSKGIVQFIPVIIQFLLIIWYLYLQNNSEIISNNSGNMLSKKQVNFIFTGYLSFLILYAAGGNGVIDRIQFFLFPFIIIASSIFWEVNNLSFETILFRSVLLLFWISYCILRLILNNANVVPYVFR